MKIVTIYPYFYKRGGAQDLALILARSLDEEQPVVLTNSPSIDPYYLTFSFRFEKFTIKNIWKYHTDGAIFLSHHRKTTSILVLLNWILLSNKMKLVYVAHNLFNNFKYISFFPKHIVAVSNSVKQCLVSYYGLKENRITVILNGIIDHYQSIKTVNSSDIKNNIIKVILPASLIPVKQQVELVRHTKGRIASHVCIFFAGNGPDVDKLRAEIDNSSQYVMLGYIDIYKELYKYDYVCLYSLKEGLPLALVDGCMFKKPLITNDINPMLEVNMNGYNGFVVSNWEELIHCLNTLPAPSTETYKLLSENSRRVYESKFKFDVMLDSYRDLLRKL